MPDYYGKPVSTHRFYFAEDDPREKPRCLVWGCNETEDHPIHDYKA